jgi:outer membrane protein assembly factor BamA
VFVDVGSAWNDGVAQRTFKSAGVEFLAEARVGYLLGLQYRAGFARGFEAPGANVAYLQIGRSF